MKNRTNGFLAHGCIDHDSEQFDYIRELHDYLWAFVRTQYPAASGRLRDWVDKGLNKAIRAAPPERRYLITQPNVNEPYFADSYPDIMPEDVVVYDLHENRHLIDGEWFDVEVV